MATYVSDNRAGNGQWSYDPSRPRKWELERKAHPKKGFCQVRYCRNAARVAKRKSGTLYTAPLCERCFCRRWRANNPERATFINIKHRAKERGQLFDLSLQDFTAWLASTSYASERGKKPSALHIDRIIPADGYVLSNLQILTCRNNVQKRHHTDYPIDDYL